MNLEETITDLLVESGLSREDEATQQLAGNLANFFGEQYTMIEFNAHIQELQMALQQQNKVMLAGQVIDDMANRQMIDPRMLRARLDQLMKGAGKANAR